MGYEFKIMLSLEITQLNEIYTLLEGISTFDKKYELNYITFWDFKNLGNQGQLPTTSIAFEKDGIYVCQHSFSNVWTELEVLKFYFDCNKIEYEVVEY